MYTHCTASSWFSSLSLSGSGGWVIKRADTLAAIRLSLRRLPRRLPVTWLTPLAFSPLSLLLLCTDDPARLSSLRSSPCYPAPGDPRHAAAPRVSDARHAQARAAPSETCSAATWPSHVSIVQRSYALRPTSRTPLSSGTADRTAMCCETARGHPRSHTHSVRSDAHTLHSS